jgi:hypothetical protein
MVDDEGDPSPQAVRFISRLRSLLRQESKPTKEETKAQESPAISEDAETLAQRFSDSQKIGESTQLAAAAGAKESSNMPHLASVLSNLQTSISTLNSMATELVFSGIIGSFVRFGKLPPAIRHQIWTLAIPGPRILEMFEDHRGPGHRLMTNFPPPAILHVCMESREVVKKQYIVLGRVLQYSYLGHSVNFIDPAQDTIYFPAFDQTQPNKPFLAYPSGFNTTVLQSLKHLSLDIRLFKRYSLSILGLYRERFTSFEKLTLVFHEGCEDEHHELWRQKTTGIDFTEAIDAASVADTLMLVEKRIAQVRMHTPHDFIIRPLEVEVKALKRGGERCCSKAIT